MVQKIEVVRTQCGDDEVLLFRHGGVDFDLLFAEILSWERDQQMEVFGADKEVKFAIGLKTIYSPDPKVRFNYKGDLLSSLYAHQFEEGDNFSFQVFNDELIVRTGLELRLVRCYEGLNAYQGIKRSPNVGSRMQLIFKPRPPEEIPWV
jgi:hypothetical protein